MIRSVAHLSLHTSPLAQPGTGYAGGMNVYVHELSKKMAERNIDVVVFTRRTHPNQTEVVHQKPGYRIVNIDAGPSEELLVDSLSHYVNNFSRAVVDWTEKNTDGFDVIHSHYWLSGWSGILIKEALGTPLVHSFHTLGRVKENVRRPGEPPDTPIRSITEEQVLAKSNAVVTSTSREAADLVHHYGANLKYLHISPPGVDRTTFSPGNRLRSRKLLGLGAKPIVMYAGRIEAHKGIDIAVNALAKLPERLMIGQGPPHLYIIGGPSGKRGNHELQLLQNTALELGIADRVQFLPAQPHSVLADYYRAANLLIMPSRGESFGLVAVEAQACGLPIVASDVTGLCRAIATERSGIIVDTLEPAAFADAAVSLLDNPKRAKQYEKQAIKTASRFSWNSTAETILDIYGSIS